MDVNKYNVYINPIAFDNIKKNIKLIEGRLEVGIFRTIKANDIITFISKSTNETLMKKVNKINKYSSFEELILNENLKLILPWCKKSDEAVNYYCDLYKKYKLSKYIVLAIHI